LSVAVVPGDCIVLPAPPDAWLVLNVRTRTAAGLDDAGLAAWRSGVPDEAAAGRLYPAAGWFSQTDCSLHDPSRLRRDPSTWGEGVLLSGGALRAGLVQRYLLVEDPAAYERLFERPVHALDRGRLGNFHDQLGRHLLLERRMDPNAWWVGQKFTPAGDVRGDTAYGTVQAPALAAALDRFVRPGDHVLDAGCGTGYYAVEMARRGARVLGIDPEPAHLERARARALACGVSNRECDFGGMDLGRACGFGDLPDAAFDTIFMSDALLFAFVPISPRGSPDPEAVFAQLARVLRPGGRFVSVEPHGDFYLAPWLGDPTRPFTVLTEHRHRRFSSAPTLGQVAPVAFAHGFALVHLDELYRAPTRSTGDARADAFADEFPLWAVSVYEKKVSNRGETSDGR
jgi:SAM-dependent methyltransferase